MSAIEQADASVAYFPEIIQNHGGNIPNLPALREGDTIVSWSELATKANRIANKLIALGCGRGDKVALLGRNSIPYAEAMAGVLSSGASFVPLPTMASDEALRGMLEDSRPMALMVEPAYIDQVAGLLEGSDYICDGGLVALEPSDDARFAGLDVWIVDASDSNPAVSIEPNDAFNITYSSGTTGVPKGIILSHATRTRQAATMAVLDFGPGAVNIISTPLYSLGALSTWMPTTFAGGCNLLMRKFDAGAFLELVEARKVTHAILVPVQYDRILNHPEYDRFDLSSLKLKFGGSAPMTVSLKQQIAERMPGEMFEFYSLTEGGVTTALMINHFPDKLGSVGTAVNGCIIKIIDEDGKELRQGEIGEIVGRSGLKMEGYLNKKAETLATVWTDSEGLDFIRSGDNGYLDEDGFLFLLDRKKDMIISGGMNVYAADIEAVLHEHESIHEAAVVGIASEQWGEVPCAFVELEPGAALDEETLITWANERLGKAQRIARAIFCEELPRNHLGKVLKADLRKNMTETAVTYENLLYDVADHVATVTINRADRRNALDQKTLTEMLHAFTKAADDADVRVVLLTGAGKGFCSGADLQSGDPVQSGSALIEDFYKPVLRAITDMDKPVITAVNGAAAGAGSALAMISDLTIMADNAFILQAFSTIALVPDCGATWLLPRAMGYKRAYLAAIEADRLDAERCLDMGLANRVVASDVLMEEAQAWAAKLARRAPLALGLTKKAMRAGLEGGLSDAISHEGLLQSRCLESEDFKIGIMALFEKSEPTYVGR